MKKIDKLYYKNKIIDYMFNDNFIECPLFYNNTGKSIRFLLEGKLEQKKYDLIINVFYDIFYKFGNMVCVSFGDKGVDTSVIKKYYRILSLKKIVKVFYNSKLDPDYFVINKPFYIAYLSKVLDFNINKYLRDLYEDNLDADLVFLNVRHGVALHFYDDRGFDIVCEDKEFAKYLYDKYQEDIMECNIDFNQE